MLPTLSLLKQGYKDYGGNTSYTRVMRVTDHLPLLISLLEYTGSYIEQTLVEAWPRFCPCAVPIKPNLTERNPQVNLGLLSGFTRKDPE